MTTREEFEAWLYAYLLEKGVSKKNAKQMTMGAGGGSIASDAWQASRAAALEEAAKECEKLADKNIGLAIDAAEQCAMGIRALKD